MPLLFILAGCVPPGMTRPSTYAQQGAVLCEDRRTMERYVDAVAADVPRAAVNILIVNHCWLTGSERPVRRVYKKTRYRDTPLLRVRLWGSVLDYWIAEKDTCPGRTRCRRAAWDYAVR